MLVPEATSRIALYLDANTEPEILKWEGGHKPPKMAQKY